MVKKIHILGSLFFSLFVHTNYIYSQKIITEEENTINKSLLKQVDELPEKGTYQIISKGEKISLVISEYILYQVNNKRKYGEIIYINVNDEVIIKVLPFSIIRNKNFTPLKTYVYDEK